MKIVSSYEVYIYIQNIFINVKYSTDIYPKYVEFNYSRSHFD